MTTKKAQSDKRIAEQHTDVSEPIDHFLDLLARLIARRHLGKHRNESKRGNQIGNDDNLNNQSA
jgi:hypothetical protein